MSNIAERREARAQLTTPPLRQIAWRRTRDELRTFRRVPEEMFFTFALPILLMSLFASIFGGELGETGVDASQYFVASMLASAGLTVGFQSLSGQLALERHDGTLTRLSATPMPPAAYLLGKIGLVAAIVWVQICVMFAVGVTAFGVSVPSAMGVGLLFLVTMLNVTVWSLLGLSFSRVTRTPRAGAVVALAPTLALQFISGVYIVFDQIPSGLQQVASLFPLRWAALGTRQALLPDELATAEVGGSWQTSTMLAVLLAWVGLSAAIATRSFRWRSDS